MDIRSLNAARNYQAARPATEPAASQSGARSTFDPGAAAQDFAATLDAAEDVAIQSMSSGADPHSLVLALAQTELAVETAVTVRDKVVEAYQEILRMPV